jgi:AraC-like DNA-binding protein
MSKLVSSGTEIEHAVGASRMSRHHHTNAYAALVLRGGYLEAGDCGRFHATAGDVLFHAPFAGHSDWFAAKGADILNLSLGCAGSRAFGRCADPDAVSRLAERDRFAAAELLVQTTVPCTASPLDWPDMLAEAIRSDSSLSLGGWARLHGIASATVSRGFRRAYGVSPKRYRVEQRAATAARAICAGMTLSAAAFASGFADQPHMSRAIADLFDQSPARLRV